MKAAESAGSRGAQLLLLLNGAAEAAFACTAIEVPSRRADASRRVRLHCMLRGLLQRRLLITEALWGGRDRDIILIWTCSVDFLADRLPPRMKKASAQHERCNIIMRLVALRPQFKILVTADSCVAVAVPVSQSINPLCVVVKAAATPDLPQPQQSPAAPTSSPQSTHTKPCGGSTDATVL